MLDRCVKLLDFIDFQIEEANTEIVCAATKEVRILRTVPFLRADDMLRDRKDR